MKIFTRQEIMKILQNENDETKTGKNTNDNII